MIDSVRGPAEWGRRELIFIAIARVMAVPLFAGFVAVDGDSFDAAVIVVIVGAAFYTAGILAIAVSEHWDTFDPRWVVIPDLILINIAIAADGGPGSPVAVVLFVWTIAMSMIYSSRLVIALAGMALLSYLLMALPFVLDDGGTHTDQLRSIGTFTLSQLWIGFVTYACASSYERREARIGSLSEARGRLLADALSAEDRARRQLSQSLHDDALQTLLAAGQDLDAGTASGETSQLERAREELREAVTSLRETIRGLHPAALAHGGLSGGLDVVVERAARVGGFEADLRVDPEASSAHDSLLVSVVRELATNAAKHSGAALLTVRVHRENGSITATVADDGRGISLANRQEALAGGHIGLASCAERIEAAGGTMGIDTEPGAGTTVTIELPAIARAAPSGAVGAG